MSSPSRKVTRVPRARPRARLRTAATPRLRSFRWSLMRSPWRRLNPSRNTPEPSVEASSTTTISSGCRVCDTALSSAARRKPRWLKLVTQIEMVGADGLALVTCRTRLKAGARSCAPPIVAVRLSERRPSTALPRAWCPPAPNECCELLRRKVPVREIQPVDGLQDAVWNVAAGKEAPIKRCILFLVGDVGGHGARTSRPRTAFSALGTRSQTNPVGRRPVFAGPIQPPRAGPWWSSEAPPDS